MIRGEMIIALWVCPLCGYRIAVKNPQWKLDNEAMDHMEDEHAILPQKPLTVTVWNVLVGVQHTKDSRKLSAGIGNEVHEK